MIDEWTQCNKNQVYNGQGKELCTFKTVLKNFESLLDVFDFNIGLPSKQ
jgi:hypothetical protein